MSAPQPGFVLGVDLGTSNTVAILRGPDGRTRPLLFDGQPILPSIVFVDQTGRIHVGRDAARLAQTDPARCEPNPKRRVDEGTILLGDREIPVVQLLAALLRAIAEKAVETTGHLPPAVITHPAAWGPTRRQVLLEAVRQAGWPPVRLTPEPIAAARYFAQVMRRPVPVGGSLAVFDFGGGTLDVAVVRHEVDGSFSVTASGGDQNLGGLDLDAVLVNHIGSLVGARYPQIWQHLSHPVSAADRRYRRLFWEDVRGAKEMLSRTTTAPVPVPGVDAAVHLTREELERLIGPLVERAVAATVATVAQARLRPEELSGLFLVGGSSRVPMVGRMLHARLGVAPTVLEQPELPVAEGSLAELAPQPAPVGAPYHADAPASAMPVSVLPGQHSPVSAMPTSPSAPNSPPLGPYPPYGPPPAPKPWYKRPKLMVPACAAVLVLAVVAGVALFWPRYTERPFADSLTQVTTVKFGSDSPSGTWSAVDGDTAFLATTTQSGKGTSYANRVNVQAVKLGDKKPAWPAKQLDSPNQNDWSEMIAGAGVLVLPYADTTDNSGNTVKGGATVLDEASGKTLWSHATGYDSSNDWWGVDVSPKLVMHFDAEAGTLTAWDASSGAKKWTATGVGAAPWLDQGYDNFSGTASFASYYDAQSAAPSSSRLVLLKDSTAVIWDASTGKSTARREVNADGAQLVYDGVLYGATAGNGYTLTAYPLDNAKSGDWVKWSLPAPQGWQTRYLAVCGESLVCAVEYKATGDSYDTPTNEQIRAWNIDTGKYWVYKAHGVHSPVPVGNRILVSYTKSNELRTDVLDDSGTRKTTKVGEAARIDDATALLASGDVYGLGTSSVPDASGYTLTGIGVQSGSEKSLGTVPQNLNDCRFNDTYIVCADTENDQFVVSRFRN